MVLALFYSYYTHFVCSFPVHMFPLPSSYDLISAAAACISNCLCMREIVNLSLELSHIQFTNYSLHIVDLFHISCHDISIVLTSLVIRTNTHLIQYYVSCLVVYYCMCLQTPDSILTSVTTIGHL
jgi:hypothetical protein